MSEAAPPESNRPAAGPALERDPSRHRRVDAYLAERPESWLRDIFAGHWKGLPELGAGSLFSNLLAIATSLFAMQVWDRVVPARSTHTLWVLASGVGLALLLELVLRTARVSIADHLGKQADLKLSAMFFTRVLDIRNDARPKVAGHADRAVARPGATARAAHLKHPGRADRPALCRRLPVHHLDPGRAARAGAPGGDPVAGAARHRGPDSAVKAVAAGTCRSRAQERHPDGIHIPRRRHQGAAGRAALLPAVGPRQPGQRQHRPEAALPWRGC